MATATYTPIATQTLASAAASITFSSIPSTYTDLRLVFTGTSSDGLWCVRFNSDSGTNYSYRYISGNGSAASSGASQNQTEVSANVGLSATVPSMVTMDIFSYAGSTYKTSLLNQTRDLNGSGNTTQAVWLWRSTSAINNVTISNLYGTINTFLIGTTATLYGIKAA